jgi:hypothetical protein
MVSWSIRCVGQNMRGAPSCLTQQRMGIRLAMHAVFVPTA